VRRRLPSLLCAAAAALHAWTFAGAGPLDDEFILYRYAENLIAGHGLVFQAGERVEGYTQPLWLLLLAAARALGAAPIATTRVLGAACAAGAVYAVGAAWRARFGRVPAPAILLAASPALAFHAVGGLGTPLLALCLCAWLAAYVRDEERGRASWWPAIWMGLAGLSRPETVVFLAPYLAVEAQRRRLSRAWPAVLPLAAWTVFRLAYYGRWLPVTYHMKKLPLGADLALGARYLGTATLETGALVALALAAWWAWRRPVALGRAVWVAIAGCVLHAAYVLSVGGDYMTFARFEVPVLGLLYLGACVAVRGMLLGRPGAAAAVLAAAVLALQWMQLGPRREVFELLRANEARWIAVGRALGERAAPGTSVATSAVGAIGYYSGLEIVDTLGRTNDALWRVEPDLEIGMKSHQRTDADWVFAQRPDVVLINGGREIEAAGRLVPFAWEVPLLQHPALEEYRWMAMPVEGGKPLRFFLRPAAEAPRGAVAVR
jgi:hypothetical protein